MKRFIIFSAIIAALTIVGCKSSSQNQTDSTQPTETEAITENVADTATTPAAKDTVAQEPVPAEITAIDLGLSVKWADRNIGASAPEQSGDYYAWGETETKQEYSTQNYKWYKNVNGDILLAKKKYGPEDDVAVVKLGKPWRTPTLEEIKELVEKCNWEWMEKNGVLGYKISSKTNGNSIFLPCAGFFYDDSNLGGTEGGYYWSFTPEGVSCYANYLYFCDHDIDWNYIDREYGIPVRPVCK